MDAKQYEEFKELRKLANELCERLAPLVVDTADGIVRLEHYRLKNAFDAALQVKENLK